MVDLGTHIDDPQVQPSGYTLKWQFAAKPHNLDICQGVYTPILNQVQVLETIKNCGEFRYNPSLSRRKSSSAGQMLRRVDNG